MELRKTGQWTWREDEISFKEFNLLNKEEKEEYLYLLKGLPERERSTTDLIIINLYFKKQDKPKQENYYSL